MRIESALQRDAMSSSGRGRVVMGGVLIGAALAVGSPAVGVAGAHTSPTSEAVGRPAFHDGDNPAPGVRVAQAVGDKVFNQKPGLNKTLDDSALGASYHKNFGTANYDHPNHGTYTDAEGNVREGGSNGTQQGILNTPAIYGKVYQGLGLPGEADLPGTVISQISGHPAGQPHEHAKSVSSVSALSEVPAKSGCTIRSASPVVVKCN